MAELLIEEEMLLEEETNPVFEAAHKTLLASLGAVALLQDEVATLVKKLASRREGMTDKSGDLVNKMVARGEVVAEDSRKFVTDLRERRATKAEAVVEAATDDVENRIEDVLTRMNIPTKKDIQALNRKITTLTKKVDELKVTA